MSEDFAYPNFWAAGVGRNRYKWSCLACKDDRWRDARAARRHEKTIRHRENVEHILSPRLCPSSSPTRPDLDSPFLDLLTDLLEPASPPRGTAPQYMVGLAATEESGIKSCKVWATRGSGADVSTSEPLAKRARSVNYEARVKTDRDACREMDQEFVIGLERRGMDIKNDEWHEFGFFNETTTQDQEHYGGNSGSILQPLPSTHTKPFEATPATPSFTYRTLPTTVYHRASRMRQPLGRRSSATLPHSTGNDGNCLLTSGSTDNLLSENF